MCTRNTSLHVVEVPQVHAKHATPHRGGAPSAYEGLHSTLWSDPKCKGGLPLIDVEWLDV